MSEVLLFHHVQGLTPGVRELADSIRSHGHVVHTPDLFDGRTFATIEEGMAYSDEVGMDAFLEKATAAVDALPAELVYAGISMGAMPAEKFAETRPGALGAVLLESCLPGDYFAPAWPPGVPVQVHGMDHDPFFAGEGDIDAARELAASSDDAELYVYEGDQHLFVDSSLPSYRPDAAQLVTERMLAFIDGLGRG